MNTLPPLRWVKRKVVNRFHPFQYAVDSQGQRITEQVVEVPVLQYWKTDHSCDVYVPGNPEGSCGEWVDVPVAEEDAKTP